MDILKELNIEDVLIPENEEPEESEVLTYRPFANLSEYNSTYNTIATTKLVTVISYLIGINITVIEDHFGEYNQQIIDELLKDKDATTIRYLCRLRTKLMLTFKKTDWEMRNNLQNLDRLDYFDKEEIQQLRSWGLEVIKANYRSEKYIEDFNRYINENIDKCKHIFPDWLNWNYIRELFVIPKSKKKNTIYKEEFEKFMNNLPCYPFKNYIYWTPEENCGNILYCDGKFLPILYRQHGEEFKDKTKYRDASEGTKKNIYEFIDQAQKVQLVVDCENSDAFKLYSALKSLEDEETSKIAKIVLFDDIHTSNAWDYLENLLDIPIEHEEVSRVTERKSLVDVKMTAGICKAHYSESVDSFILCSSDSDFWGVISALPDVNFLVLYEDKKCGNDIKEALTLRSIYHYSMDDFHSGESTKLKKLVLKKTLKDEIEEGIIGRNGYEIAKTVYDRNYIEASESDIKQFYDKYIKALRLKLDECGNFYIELAE